MSLDDELENVIWGRKSWNAYVSEIIECETLDERMLLERIEIVKGNVGRQLRKVVEQNHSRLVEQAGALQGLDSVREVICAQMKHLHDNVQNLAQRFALSNEELQYNAHALHRLYAINRIVLALNSCEKLLGRLDSLNELVKRSETICEVESVIADTQSLCELSAMKEALIETIPKVIKECRQTTMEQLRSSMQTLHAPMVQSCVRALHNLNCYDAEVNQLLEEEAAKLDADFLKLSTQPQIAHKLLPALAASVQSTLEQFSFLGRIVAKKMSDRIANTIRTRVPENAPYAGRIVQHLSEVLRRTIATEVQPIVEALEPLKRSAISHALQKMFQVTNEAFDNLNAVNSVVDKVDTVIREQLATVEWDTDLMNEMENNIKKTMELCAQRIEQMLVLDDDALQISEHISSVQNMNYTALNIASSLSDNWNRFSHPLIRVMDNARDALIRVAHTAIRSIVLSLHNEPLRTGTANPSPYARELYDYVTVFKQHADVIRPVMYTIRTMHNFIQYVIEIFLLSATLIRPISREQLQAISKDLLHVADALRAFDLNVSLLNHIQEIAAAIQLEPDQLINAYELPFWVPVQLLIARCDPTILSPPESAGWTKQEYVEWFMIHTDFEHIKFFKALIEFYTISAVANNRTEFVQHYHQILEVMRTAYDRPEESSSSTTSVEVLETPED